MEDRIVITHISIVFITNITNRIGINLLSGHGGHFTFYLHIKVFYIHQPWGFELE